MYALLIVVAVMVIWGVSIGVDFSAFGGEE